MIQIYGGILDQIVRQDYDVFGTRARVPTWGKLGIAARAWLQARDSFQRLLHVLHVMFSAAGNFRDSPLAERLHEFINDAIFQGVLLARTLHLQQQTFAQIARADTWRIETLNGLEHLLNLFRRQTGGCGTCSLIQNGR